MANYVIAGASSKIAIETAQQLQALGHTVTGISTKPQQGDYDRFIQVSAYTAGQLPELGEPINGLVYFPGTIMLKPFRSITEADFMNDFQINCIGATAVIRQYFVPLKKAGNASVVLISSVAAQAGMPFHSSIAMAKGAIESLTRSLAAEFAPDIRVNCVAPSLTATPLSDKFINTPEKMEAIQKKNPLRKIGDPADVANAITYLLTPSSAWVTGQVLAVDGGMGALRL